MSEPAIRITGAGKMYKVFASRGANLLDSLGLRKVLPERLTAHQEFWALRGIDLDLNRGQRIGIIGRNGAGKTTLLKLITGNLAPTEGAVAVSGRVQSLMDAGGGLHPEFTGRENIRAVLTYQGMSSREINHAEAEIADFTELGDFIERPFKTYSLGMQARLAFTLATSVRPEILVVDEMLGAGDAYFFGKSTARMQRLVDSGASVLIVSHALDQIVRFCEQTIWLDRGQVVARGNTLEVAKAYEKFIRVLEDRRLRGKNVKVSSNRFRGLESEGYADSIIVRMTVQGPPGARCEVTEVALFRDEALEDRVLLGSPQDADIGQSSFVLLDSGAWSHPIQEEGQFLRRLEIGPENADNGSAAGMVKIFCWAFENERDHTVELRYRATADAQVTVEVVHENTIRNIAALAPASHWQVQRIEIEPQAPVTPDAEAAPAAEGSPPAPAPAPGPAPDPIARAVPDIPNLSRWPGEGGLVMESVELLDGDGREQAVFHVHAPMTIRTSIRARNSGIFTLIMAGLVFRIDGIVVTRHIGDPVELELEGGQTVDAILDLGRLTLGNGYYVLSLGLYRKLDIDDIEAPEIYDYLDRSYEFQVVGNPRLHNELFRHPGRWTIEAPVTSDGAEPALSP
jgi:lipopolysaccharide transport system ATP-binding protein